MNSSAARLTIQDLGQNAYMFEGPFKIERKTGLPRAALQVQTIEARPAESETWQITCLIMLKSIAEILFSRRSNTVIEVIRAINSEIIPRITEDELLKVCKKVNDKKTSGPNGVPNKAVKSAVRTIQTKTVGFADGINMVVVAKEAGMHQHTILKSDQITGTNA